MLVCWALPAIYVAAGSSQAVDDPMWIATANSIKISAEVGGHQTEGMRIWIRLLLDLAECLDGIAHSDFGVCAPHPDSQGSLQTRLGLIILDPSPRNTRGGVCKTGPGGFFMEERDSSTASK